MRKWRFYCCQRKNSWQGVHMCTNVPTYYILYWVHTFFVSTYVLLHNNITYTNVSIPDLLFTECMSIVMSENQHWKKLPYLLDYKPTFLGLFRIVSNWTPPKNPLSSEYGKLPTVLPIYQLTSLHTCHYVKSHVKWCLIFLFMGKS